MREFELTRRRILAGVGGIGLASATAGLGTSAYFSDTETVESNEIRAGEVDLYVDYETAVSQDGVTTGSTTNDGTIDGDGTATGEYVINDLTPGDSGSLQFSPKIVDNPGWLWIGSTVGVTDYENGQTEPEGDVDGSDAGSLGNVPSGAGAGELSAVLQVDVSYCTESGGVIHEFQNPADYTLADLFKELESGFLLDGDATTTGTDAYPSSPDSSTQNGPCLCIEWEVPTDVGNEIQSDGVAFGLTFAAYQTRNNPAPQNPFADATVLPGDAIQSAVDDASAGDVVSVFGGTFGDGSDYTEAIDVDTPLTLARASAERPVVEHSNGSTVDVQADDVTVDGFEIRNPGTQGSGDPTDYAGTVGIDVSSGSENVCLQHNVLADIGTGDDDANPIGILASDGTSGITIYGNELRNLEGTDEDEGAVQAILVNESGTQITDATVRGNTITGLLDTRSTVAVRFNGDVSGVIDGNEISDLNTEGTIPGSGGAPGGFTQVISLAQGGGSATGPSNVTIRENTISDVETTTSDNFAPPFHVVVGSSTDGSTVTIESNEFSGDSQDDEVYVGDGTGSLDLSAVLTTNSFTPAGTISGTRIERS